MKELSLLLKLGCKFFQKYALEYLKLLFPIILLGMIVFVLLSFSMNGNVVCALLALFVGFPCFCIAFWKGFLMTYALNFVALDFIKQTPQNSLKEYYQQAKKDSKKFACYISFCAILTILLYLPTVLFFTTQKAFNVELIIFYCLNSLLIMPFLNFFTQAYFFKKENENFLNLFLNCYKNLNLIGALLSFVFVALSIFSGVVYLVIALFLNVFCYSINTFWYYSRENRKN